MSMYVWYSKSTSVTGRALKEALQCAGGIKAPKRYHDHVVCYGAIPKTVTHRVLDGKTYLNDAFVVREYADKYKALIVLSEHGVSVPAFSKSPNTLTFPILRRPDKHSGGSGFELFRDTVELYPTQGKHYMQFIDAKAEYRVHVFGGDIIRISRKKARHENANTECKSHANGWYFSKCDITRVSDRVKVEAIKAVEALGYDFGAVDIVVSKTGGDAYVLEVNSGAGLDGSGIALYVERIKQWETDNNGGICL